jgi:hypothetical protein
MAARPSTPNRISLPAAMERVEPMSLEAALLRVLRETEEMAFMVCCFQINAIGLLQDCIYDGRWSG